MLRNRHHGLSDMWHDIGSYVLPLLVVGLIVRRGIRAKPRKVRMRSMWILPILIALATWTTLADAPPSGFLNAVLFSIALAAGLAVGWLRARHMAFFVDPQTGRVTSKATPIGTILVVALFVVRFGLKIAMPGLPAGAGHHAAAGALLWTDAGLLFSTGLVWGRAVTTRLRVRPLIDAHRTAAAAGAD